MVPALTEALKPYRQLGERIRARRRELRIKVRDFARLVHFSQSRVWMIETGRSRPSPEMLQRFARELRLPYSELAVLAGSVIDDPAAADEAAIRLEAMVLAERPQQPEEEHGEL
jgi:transcriptional regulator with XRE-family HTH domain